MAVLIPNAKVGIRRRIEGALNAHGERTAAGHEAAPSALLPAQVEQRADGGWSISLDPELWPVRQGDLLTGDDGATYSVLSADFLTNALEPLVNHVLCEALRVGAEGTEPADPWFPGR